MSPIVVLEAQRSDNLPPCNFHEEFAKGTNFEPKGGHCTAANENLNLKKPKAI
jgi:hypothetical protein